MDVSDAVLKRASIRMWKPAPVERDKIERDRKSTRLNSSH